MVLSQSDYNFGCIYFIEFSQNLFGLWVYIYHKTKKINWWVNRPRQIFLYHTWITSNTFKHLLE